MRIKQMDAMMTFKNSRRFLLGIFVILFSGCAFFDNNPISNTAIFSGKYKALMDAAKREDLLEMEEIIKVNKLNLNCVDSFYGLSPLNWCILNDKRRSYQRLLELQADPNWQDTTGKYPPAIIEAAKLYTTYYLQLCLKHGANPNLQSKYVQGLENQTPLMGSIYPWKYMENMKLLIKSGANVNLTPDSLWSPLVETLIQREIIKTKYLLEHGADYHAKLKANTGEYITILQLLRQMDYPLGSSQYKIKMEVVKDLKTKGLNYWTEPIPQIIVKSHKNDSSYLSQY